MISVRLVMRGGYMNGLGKATHASPDLGRARRWACRWLIPSIWKILDSVIGGRRSDTRDTPYPPARPGRPEYSTVLPTSAYDCSDLRPVFQRLLQNSQRRLSFGIHERQSRRPDPFTAHPGLLLHQFDQLDELIDGVHPEQR